MLLVIYLIESINLKAAQLPPAAPVVMGTIQYKKAHTPMLLAGVICVECGKPFRSDKSAKKDRVCGSCRNDLFARGQAFGL
jgi:hypothetical protein